MPSFKWKYQIYCHLAFGVHHIQDIITNDRMTIDQESSKDSYSLIVILLCFSPIASSILLCPVSKENPHRLKTPPLFGHCPTIWTLSDYLSIVQLFGHCPTIWSLCPTIWALSSYLGIVQLFGHCPTIWALSNCLGIVQLFGHCPTI